jgi:hypothetical protein
VHIGFPVEIEIPTDAQIPKVILRDRRVLGFNRFNGLEVSLQSIVAAVGQSIDQVVGHAEQTIDAAVAKRKINRRAARESVSAAGMRPALII